jgi:hypothetical protein
LLEDVIPVNGIFTSDIRQSPNGMITDIENRGGEQLDELWDSVGINDHLNAVRGSACNVR